MGNSCFNKNRKILHGYNFIGRLVIGAALTDKELSQSFSVCPRTISFGFKYLKINKMKVFVEFTVVVLHKTQKKLIYGY